METQTTAGEGEGLRGAAGGRSFSAPRGGLGQARLLFAGGCSDVRLGTEAAEGELFHASFHGRPPTVSVEGGVVAMEYPLFRWLDFWRSGAQIALSPALPWELGFSCGLSELEADLSGLELKALQIRGGASELSVSLPRPKGVVRIGLRGGASEVTFRRPAGTHAHLRVKGGACRLGFDAQRLGAIGGTTELATEGCEQAADRYEIEVRGGASHLSVLSW